MRGKMFISTKTFEHLGSVCFRQWRAESHCNLLHGYALTIRIEFQAKVLDDNNWVIDFGGLKSFRTWLEDKFDHTLIVAQDDPQLLNLEDLGRMGLAKVVVLPSTGCETFASYIFHNVEAWLKKNGHAARVKVRLVEVAEHGANSAIYTGDK
jgi:6-pyruvoyltetrahydropterin/6-carboxytetrahydropterin synthase